MALIIFIPFIQLLLVKETDIFSNAAIPRYRWCRCSTGFPLVLLSIFPLCLSPSWNYERRSDTKMYGAVRNSVRKVSGTYLMSAMISMYWTVLRIFSKTRLSFFCGSTDCVFWNFQQAFKVTWSEWEEGLIITISREQSYSRMGVYRERKVFPLTIVMISAFNRVFLVCLKGYQIISKWKSESFLKNNTVAHLSIILDIWIYTHKYFTIQVQEAHHIRAVGPIQSWFSHSLSRWFL